MSENILVVEYEPRYTDRVRQALAGQPFSPTFAKDGEEAIKAIDQQSPRLIVLSSVVPKISTTELIRAIRGRKPLQETPILLTVSGYNGKSPKADAQRVGASDILPKPYSETEFLGKIQQMLGVRPEAGAAATGAQLTSNEIFGDLLEEDKPRKTATGTTKAADVDKMLADTLAGMMPRAKREAPAPAPPAPAPVAPAPVAPAPQIPMGAQAKVRNTGEYDKMLSDTLSGLEKSARKTTTGTVTRQPAPPAPSPVATAPPSAPPSAAAAAAPRFNTEKMSAYADRVPVSQPVLAPETTRIEDEEPTDGVKFGQYVLVEKIATGGMAEVWKARMRGVEGFQKIVAIKKILPHLSDNQDFIEMFIDEAKLAAQLNHNNIIHIYDLGKIQSSYYIAMEYIDGFDLKTILRRGQERDHPMTVELALFVASKIASALDYAHRKKDFEERDLGLVHRDVSPQNVLISQEGDIKLCDFGIAKAASKASHTQAGALKGKLQYMSPEQAWGRHIDKRSDVFALATVLFEMLTGRKLFTGDNELSILEQVREARIQPPSSINDEVTPDVDKIVLKALNKDAAHRYQTAGEMARDIDAVLYNFRPTPTSADLAIYMHRLSSPEQSFSPAETVIDAPLPVAPSTPAPVPRTIAAVPLPTVAMPVNMPATFEPAIATPTFGEVPASIERKSSTGLIIGAIAALLVIGGIVFFVMRKPSTATPATGTQVAANTASAPVPATTTSTTVPTTAATLTAGTTAPASTLDPSAVDAEVKRRLDEQRKLLEAQARAQGQTPAPATTTSPATRPVVPAPAPQETQPAPVAPAPVETRPTPQPVQPAPEPVVPAPAPVVARAREGDLVPAGTEGLTPPRVTRRGTVNYPPIAARQKVEGTVITSVLVSETGAVLEVRILRGVTSRVGLNEAAEQAMRRSTFAPATKDGVRVRSWVTVPVEFKL